MGKGVGRWTRLGEGVGWKGKRNFMRLVAPSCRKIRRSRAALLRFLEASQPITLFSQASLKPCARVFIIPSARKSDEFKCLSQCFD